VGDFDHIVAALEASPITAELKAMVASEDFSRLDKNAAKRHHFLSQFLLRGFAQTHDLKGCVFQMSTQDRKAPLRVDVKKAASRRHLYEVVDEDGISSNRNEGYLALVEHHAAPALRTLLENPESLSPGERATIAFFVAFQTMRTPAAAEQVTEAANAAFQSWAAEFHSDREAFADSYREHFGTGASSQEIEECRQETISQIRAGHLRLTGQAAALSTGLIHAVDRVPVLIEFDWTLLQAAGGFITSDRGYAIDDPTPPFPWATQAILSSPNSETSVPLSDTACLLMRPLPMGGGLTVRQADSHEVETINLRTFAWASEYVFGKTQQALVHVRIAARRRRGDVIGPKQFNQVVLIEVAPDDQSLIEANLRQGWPPQLMNEHGELRDYLVIPADGSQPELRKRADELTEARARKRAGISSSEPFEGHITSTMLDPVEMSLSNQFVKKLPN
jgi:Protein of unknown function (DUF4238)